MQKPKFSSDPVKRRLWECWHQKLSPKDEEMIERRYTKMDQVEFLTLTPDPTTSTPEWEIHVDFEEDALYKLFAKSPPEE